VWGTEIVRGHINVWGTEILRGPYKCMGYGNSKGVI